VVEQFFNPAHESVLPEVASDEELAAANSMMAISSFGSTAIGFAASGLIASRLPIEWAFYLDGLTFLLSAVALFFVHIRPLEIEGKTSVALVLRNLRSGARFLLDTPILRSLLMVSIPTILAFGLWNSLLLPFAVEALNASEFEYGLQEGLTSVGFVFGSFMMARLADRLQAGQWLTISYLGMGLVGLFYAQTASIPIAIALVTVSGFLNAPSSIARRMEVQRSTERQVRGRVVSAFLVTRNVLFLFGMGAAGLADVVDVRMMFVVSAVLLLVSGALTLVMPGLGRPAAEWRQALSLLRGAAVAPGLGAGRMPTPADMDLLVGHLPALKGLSRQAQDQLRAQARVVSAEDGTTILRQGETSDAAYFILEGRAVAGYAPDRGDYRSLSTMRAGDFFGEIAALTGSPRTATVVTAEPTLLLQVPAEALRGLMADPELSQLFLTTMNERLGRTHKSDLPRFAGLDQDSLRELRTPSVEERTGPSGDTENHHAGEDSPPDEAEDPE
jgi:CRP-like cAMP-binding protein